jgi:hypothetical protein
MLWCYTKPNLIIITDPLTEMCVSKIWYIIIKNDIVDEELKIKAKGVSPTDQSGKISS